MLCPTDSYYNRRPFNGTAGSMAWGSGTSPQFGDNWARGNYAANGGLADLNPNAGCGWFVTGPSNVGVLDGGTWGNSWAFPPLRGISGSNCGVRAAQVIDGLHNTIMLAELRAGVAGMDPRGIWAMGGAPSCLYSDGGWWGDDWGPNATNPLPENIWNCDQIRLAFGDQTTAANYLDANLMSIGMGCYPEPNDEQGPRSLHVNGVNVCMADGSARWISDYIQVFPTEPYPLPLPWVPGKGTFSVWDRLLSSADGQQIPADAF